VAKASFHAVVTGRVQGVFFRMFVLRVAGATGVCGIVRNRLDGAVEVQAEGERDKLEQFIERLRQGPPKSAVDNVAAEWDEYRHDYDDFTIEYD
jgi:acylphosphatase